MQRLLIFLFFSLLFLFSPSAWAGDVQLAPNGTYVGGKPQLAPNGTYVGGEPQLAPNGKYVGTGDNGE